MKTENLIKDIKNNPEKVKKIVKKVLLVNRINEDLQELFYLIPTDKRGIIESMCDMIKEI